MSVFFVIQDADADNYIHQFAEYVTGVKEKFSNASSALNEAVQAWDTYHEAHVTAIEVLQAAEKEMQNGDSDYRVSSLVGSWHRR